MAFSGGTFSRTFDCTTDRDNGVKILASKFDTELDGMATGLSTCILKDGTQTCTAAIPFAEGLTVPDNKTIILGTNSDITISYDESTNDSLEIAANVEGAALGIVLKADQGDDNADQHKVNIADGGTLTMASKISGSFVSYLTHTPNSTVASSTTAVAGNLTVGGDLTLGSGAVISEAELEAIDGVTAGTVTASKAVIVDSNKDIASFRNVTLTGELDAGSLDVSGDADIDGTLETDALSINGTAVTATGAELNYSDTGAAVGTVVASKVVTADANKDVASFRNITLTGELDAGSLDVSGDADIDGTLEADAMTLNGTAITATATLDTGISNNNVPKFTSGVADNDFLRVDGTAIEGRSASEVLSDIAAAPAAGSSNIVTTGALNSGSITSGFGAIDNGSSAITTTGVITGGTLEATADTSAGDNAAIGYTAAEGLILTGQGSTSDITLKNDADATVFNVPTGQQKILFPDNARAMFGDSSDLQIYHDSSDSYVNDTGTGNLRLAGSANVEIISSGGEFMAKFVADGASTLYHNNVAKIATASTGVDITGAFTATDGSTITTADNTVQLTLKSTDADGSIGPKFDLTRDSSSPANGDNCGQINFKIDNDAGESTQYGDIFVGAIAVADGSESAHMTFSTMKGGSRNSRIKLHSDETVFNEDSVDVDFRVESDEHGHAFFVDGEDGNISMGLDAVTVDSSLAGVSVPSGSRIFNINDADGAYLKLTDPSSGSNRGAAVALFNTTMVLNNAESDKMIFGTGNAQRMQITSSGNLRIGQSNTDSPGFSNTTVGAAIRSVGDGFFCRDDDRALYTNRNDDGHLVSFRRSGSEVGTVQVTSSGTTYNTTSDIRLKQDIEPLEATDKLMAMNPVSHAWKANPDGPRSMGFIAQEMEELCPDAVSTGDDDEAMMSMDYGRITPILVSALQDAHKKIEELESRIAAMESK